MIENSIKVFDYKGSKISFANGKNVMVNATEMAKSFAKTTKDWLRTNASSEFINSLSAVRQICPTELVKVVQGGSPELQGTWMHEDVALEFCPISKMRHGDNQQVTYKLQNTNKKLMKNFAVMKNISIFALFTVNESHSFRRASGKVAQSKLGIFYARTLRYWRLPIRSYIQVLRGECINCEQRIWQPLSSYKVCL